MDSRKAPAVFGTTAGWSERSGWFRPKARRPEWRQARSSLQARGDVLTLAPAQGGRLLGEFIGVALIQHVDGLEIDLPPGRHGIMLAEEQEACGLDQPLRQDPSGDLVVVQGLPRMLEDAVRGVKVSHNLINIAIQLVGNSHKYFFPSSASTNWSSC